LARELRTAARLVFAELAHSAATIVTAQQNGVWTETDRKDLKHNRWREHQQALAGHLPDEDWEAVEHAYELLYLVYQHRPVSDADRMPTELYDRTLSVLESARPALTAYARTISPADGE
jgi:hypothetical protein